MDARTMVNIPYRLYGVAKMEEVHALNLKARDTGHGLNKSKLNLTGAVVYKI